MVTTTAADAAKDAAAAASTAAGATAAAAVDAAKAILDAVPDEAKEEAAKLVSNVENVLTSQQMREASSVIIENLKNAPGATSTVCTCIGGAFTQVAECAPDVTQAVSDALIAIGPALGPISIACGVLGVMMNMFVAAKENDKNVKTVALWSASVKDWLLLVTTRVHASGFESTLPLFQGLQEEMECLFKHIKKQHDRSFCVKMLTSGGFKRDFERTTARVKDLKEALRDFLDQEQQDAHEKALADVQSAQLEVADKLNTMDEQLGAIREMLAAQQAAADAAAKEKAASDATQKAIDEDSAVYAQIQQLAGAGATEGDVKFKYFVCAFELFFYDNNDLTDPQRRGLKIAIDRDNNGAVNKPEFIKFFRSWKASAMPMQDYIAKIEEEAPPTLYAELKGAATGETAQKALATATDAAQKGAKAASAAIGKGMGSMSSMFGGKQKGEAA